MTNYGADPTEWQHFSLVLGLTGDLLPVVSNPTLTISPTSAMKALGKTPSRINGHGYVSGFPDWTKHVASQQEIKQWSGVRDYGISLQTRSVRALDIDVDDARAAEAIARAFGDQLPARVRANSGKRLLAFTLEGDYAKRSFKTAGGMVEFLASGQQCIVAGTHPSGARYEWAGGLPDEFPVLTAEQFEAAWALLVREFAIEPVLERKAGAVAISDPVADWLQAEGWVLGSERDGRLHVRCPWEGEHTTEGGVSAATYWPAHTGGYSSGSYLCMHAHCSGRGVSQFRAAIGFEAAGFDVVSDAMATGGKRRFEVIPASEYVKRPPVSWIIKGVLPAAQLVIVFGETGSGKSFILFDMLAAISLGVPWRDRKVKKMRCVYVVAEGAAGLPQRIVAYQRAHGAGDLDIGIVDDAPNLMRSDDVEGLTDRIATFGPVGVVVLDTLAAMTPGANENAGDDMGKALAHCKAIHARTGAVVLLVHHTGKDVTRGSRGWSGLKGNVDTEMEVSRCDSDRVLTISKHRDGGGEGDCFGFRLNEVVTGVDEDGDPLTSMVVEHTAAVKRQKRAKPGEVGERVLGVLDGFLEPPDMETLRVKVVDEMEAGVPDRRRDRVSQAINSLTKAGWIKDENGVVVRANV